MNRFLLFSFLTIIILTPDIFAQLSNPPKRELRAAWLATVINLDWPPSPNSSTEIQKARLIEILDELKASGINTIIFQVRTECDALYQSGIDPWSYWLTGAQGFPPSPYYDPLEFAIEEAHNRGMELHAWFNPYRADRDINDYSPSSNHVTNTHPEWIFTISTFKFLNPGLREVRDYIKSVIGDVVSRYDVDGIHFDDYFYPYPPNNMTANAANNALDDSTFAADPRGFTNKENWRRDNVNIMVQAVYDTIQIVKPYVKFGISPFGIWKNGVPPGITGLDAYSIIYCDAIAWLQAQSIDYLTPQLYWRIGGPQDYSSLSSWWADSVAAHDRHLYPGHAVYRITTWTASEMPNQIRIDRANPDIQGSVFFRTGNFFENPLGFTDSLKNDLYRFIALNPSMDWKDNVNPNPPENLTFGRLENGSAGLNWNLPLIASDGDSASRYVVYRFEDPNIQPSDLDDPSKILNIEGRRFSTPDEPPDPTGPYYFVATSLDRNYNESAMSNVVEVFPPQIPVLAYPSDGSVNLRDTIIIGWNYPEFASSYRVQVSTDPAFTSNIVIDESGIQDTFRVTSGLEGQTKYYWRVSASNAGGVSNFSSAFSFTTGFPVSPQLSYPPDNTGNHPVDINLIWFSSNAADSYQLQVAREIDFAPQSMVLDTTGLTDTTFALSQLAMNTFYYWHIKAFNQFGASNWSAIWRFKTLPPVGVDEEEKIPQRYGLEQNYPNPFNPTTTIKFSLPHAGYAKLKVYNLLGQEIAVLLNDYRNAGYHEIFFDASQLASGIYIYRLITDNFTSSKKMILLR
ncbi:MAG: family 10 glycosylhydrolase [Ignavibacteria bacterium]|nr:family 10 glycosylhydrolase [Ignavibacteria bacterium]